jgi:hypothetical protein
MKLDRNIDANAGRGKYALLKLRRLDDFREQGAFGEVAPEIAKAITTLADVGILDWGKVGTEDEFFVIRLKDKYAAEALEAYAAAAIDDDPEYAGQVRDMADRAGLASQWCKKPD